MAVKRLWHGWTTPENAAAYESVLREQVFPGIENQKIMGYRSIELLRRDGAGEVEFVTVMTFDELANVVAFQGEDYERSHVPAAARAVLSRWDERSAHYEVRETRRYDG